MLIVSKKNTTRPMCQIYSKLTKKTLEQCLVLLLLKVTSNIKWYFLKMCHLRCRLRMLLFCRKVMFCSQYIQVFVILTIPWFSKSKMWWWVLVCEIGCIFQYIFWTTTHELTKLGQMIDICKGNNFKESFEQFGGLGLSFRSFSI